MIDEQIGIQGVPTGNLSAGVGYIIIPKDVDVKLYKKDVYRSGRVSIYGGYGYGDFHNVPVDREVLQRIKFPDKAGKYGTPVVWVNIPKHNEPIIIATLKYDDEFHSLSEHRVRFTKSVDGKLVDVDFDALLSKVSIGISSTDANKPAVFEVNLTSKNDDSKFKLNVNGEVTLHSSGRTVIISEDKIETVVSNTEGKNVARVVLDSNKEDGTKRFTYEDEFKNAVYVSKDEFQIKADDSSKIKFGEGKEPMVLGNTMKSQLDDIISAMQKLTVPTAFGPSGTPINIAEFLSVQQQFSKFLSKLTNTD